MKTIKTVLITFVLTLLLAGIGYFAIIRGKPTDPGPQISALKLQGTINEIGELATAEYSYRLTEIADKDNITILGIKIPFTDGKIIYSYEGTVKAGVAFQAVEVTVDNAAKTIYISLPEAEIVSSEVDFDSLIVYDERFSPLNGFTFEDMNKSMSALKETAESAALESGLLARAAQNAKNILQASVAGTAGAEGYSVLFR